ncbi:hypothetical protein EVB32_272 [Rhizobium phage RHph_TM39]|uniref:Uncharacterized protein n=1 Tax=Rhizobium phage RHph_Y65 TaxID=2509785 RepID=A0A7S5RIG7_9CAUD|nr:hypothetical protein PQC17_gp360 [Rhizobium phage RHph_Y65]QIG72114.1 hypothetical protein EVB95_290 [Rhizobium phage RHph_TM2_3B]QIG72839.1 hypothetical protein EVB97_291 [Rhizobium phage RHph_Y65]QIG77250.1 hypothetical protein EVB32_272 [Rhizobium phage RHph_TM39]QIG77866.1 hypothetical protein EVB64_290 [Rhizobium phage RHph_TM61]
MKYVIILGLLLAGCKTAEERYYSDLSTGVGIVLKDK